MSATFPYRRLIVVGATGSGKSTLAERLAARLDLAYVELDALFWQPNWIGTPDEEFAAKVEAATHGAGWVVAGNYSRVRQFLWPRAQAIVWIDYPFWTIFWRLLKRTLRRTWTRELLWGTNFESFLPHLKLWSDESLFGWLLKTYWRRKREYPELFGLAEHAHLQIFHFHTPKEVETWLSGL